MSETSKSAAMEGWLFKPVELEVLPIVDMSYKLAPAEARASNQHRFSATAKLRYTKFSYLAVKQLNCQIKYKHINKYKT